MKFPQYPDLPREKQPLLIFDGTCKFCNFWVKFVFKHDKKSVITFAHLQSIDLSDLVHQKDLKAFKSVDSVLFVDHGVIYTHMDAVKKILKNIDNPWRFGLFWIPNFIGHPLYNLIAAIRYIIIGKSEGCINVAPEMKQRIIADLK
jgi:predicted DCC family thiol-disulfide oxidoreductase YuxK